jgi:hypothetical protein
MASEAFSTAIGPMQGDENRPVRPPSLEESTAQNLGVQVLNQGAEKEITEARPPWRIQARIPPMMRFTSPPIRTMV